jgi:hypothetical protein
MTKTINNNDLAAFKAASETIERFLKDPTYDNKSNFEVAKAIIISTLDLVEARSIINE